MDESSQSLDGTVPERESRASRGMKARFKALADHSAMGVWEVTPSGDTLYANITMCALLEVDSVEALRGGSFRPFFTEESLRVVERERARRHKNVTSTYEAEIVGRRGARRNVLVTGAPVFDEEGRLESMIGTFLDITERKRAEQAVRDSDALYSSLVEHLPMHVYRKDGKGRVTFGNRHYFAAWNRPEEEIVGRTDGDLFPGKLAEKYREDDRRVLEQGETIKTVENHYKPGEGMTHVQVVKFPVYDSEDRIVGTQGIFWDVTERQREEALLRGRNRVLETLADRAPLEETLAAVAGAVVEIGTSEHAAVWLLDGSAGALRLAGSAGAGSGGQLPETIDLSNEAHPVAAAVAGGGGVLVDEGSHGEHGKALQSLVGSSTVRCCWVEPIPDDSGAAAGALVIWYELSTKPREDDLSRVRALTQLAGIAIERHAVESERQERLRRARAEQAVIMRLSKSAAFTDGEFHAAACLANEGATEALEVSQAGVWLLSEDGAELRCVDLYQSDSREHSEGLVLKAAEYPDYFRALEEKRAVAAADALQDPRTREFAESYLRPQRIFSLLDAPIRVSGKVAGVICHEHQGRMREWTDDEITFAGDLADQLALVLINAERRRAEAALRETEQWLQLAQSASGMGTFDLDPATRQTKCSDGYLKIFGLPKKSGVLSEEEWLGIVHPEDRERVLECFREAAERGGEFAEEHRIVRAPEEVRWLSVKGRAVREDPARPLRLIGTIADITERRQAELDKLNMERKLQESQKLESLGVLAGGIAHDFNNLLTSIIGNASLARMELSRTSPMLAHVKEIEGAAIRAADLCKQMLAYSGKGKFNIARIDLSRLAEETTHLLQLAISKKATLKFNLGTSIPAILADATQLRQIVMNLVINASEAIGERSGIITLSTGVMRADREYLKTAYLSDELPEGDYVYLEVSDNGSGMDAETRDRIFDPFFTTKFTGRGLGLAAVLGIVRGHKGSLKVYSEPGKGSTFKLMLPCADGPAEEYASVPGPPGMLEARGNVLVVDDEDTVRATAARILESFGFKATLSPDGAEAVKTFKAASTQFRLVLLDLTMPHLDGEETFRELRRIKPDVEVILMSGFNEQDAVERFVGKGLAGFLQKPFGADDLRDKLAEVLSEGEGLERK